MVRLPRALDERAQIIATEVLGFGSAAKLLSSPYPLGGYNGFEIGMSSEFIPIDDVSRLGSKSDDRGEYSFYNLSVGKGLFYNLDAYVHFTPFPQEEEVSGYGGMLRWAFWNFQSFPASLSLITHANTANFSNQITTTTVGADVVASVNMEQVSLYFGAGTGRAQGAFIGGTKGITASGDSTRVNVSEDHTLFGIHMRLSKMFLALQVDRYVNSTYSGKLGFRF